MAFLSQLYTNTLSNQNIATALLVGTFTNTTRERLVLVNLWADQIAGNGNYVAYAKVQRAGAGSAYEMGGRTTVAVPSGVTAQAFPSIFVKLNATDVLTCFVVGLAGDTTTPDLIMEVDEEFVLTDARGGVDLGSILGTALTETAGQIAAAFVKFFNKATPTGTVNSLPDTVAGAANGLALVGSRVDLVDGAITPPKVATGVVVGTSPTAGAYTVTLTVEDADSGDPIPNVFVIIKGSDDVAGVDKNTTDANGVAVFALNADTYKVHLALPPAYQSAVEDLTVIANTAQTYDLTANSIGAPSSPDLCRVYGYEYLDGTAVENREVKVRLINTPQTTDSVILERTEQTHTSDADGYWYFDLVREKKYRLVIDAAGVDKVITVPDAVSVNARTLL